MKAMIFAAGLGTRLKPLTNDRPKAMVEVNGKPMIGHLLHHLAGFGFRDFVVNVHHFADVLCHYLESDEFSGYSIRISDERGKLLETGGGLLNARELLADEEHVLVHNVDVWSDIDINHFIQSHKKSGAIASLAVRDRQTSRYLLFNNNSELIGWKNVKTGEVRMSRNEKVMKALAFSGIHMLSRKFLDKMTGEGAFSIIDTFLEFAKTEKISAYDHSSGYWSDLGKPEAIKMHESRQF